METRRYFRQADGMDADTVSLCSRGAPDDLPTSVRYVKNGEGSRWWKAAKEGAQIHAGWSSIPDELLAAGDLTGAYEVLTRQYGGRRGLTQDFNQLRALLEQPSQHIWTTIEDGCLCWCTVRDGVAVNPSPESKDRGHFWLACDRPWNNTGLDGRELLLTNLPGAIAATRGFRGTVCAPAAAAEILRVIFGREDEEAIAARAARLAYEAAVLPLIRRLHEKDFELLVDLILARTGWSRVARLGGTTEGSDIEAENAATNELAFVQIKSRAGQATLNDYVRRFHNRPSYDRMIFAVHTPEGAITPPDGGKVHLWIGERLAELVVRLGLGDWVALRI